MAKLILSFFPLLFLLVAVPFMNIGVAAVGSGGGGRGRGGSGRPFVQQTSPSIQQFFSEFNPNTPSPPPPHSPGGGRGVAVVVNKFLHRFTWSVLKTFTPPSSQSATTTWLTRNEKAELLRLVTDIFTETNQQQAQHCDLYLDILFNVFREEFASAFEKYKYGKGSPFIVFLSDLGLLPDSVQNKKGRRGMNAYFEVLDLRWKMYQAVHRGVPSTFNPQQMVTVEPDLFRIFFEHRSRVSYGEAKQIIMSYVNAYPVNENGEVRKRTYFEKSPYAKVRACRVKAAFILLVIQPFLRQAADGGGGGAHGLYQPNPQLHSPLPQLKRSPRPKLMNPEYNLVKDNDCYSTLLPDRHGTKRQYWLVDDTSFHSFLLSDLPADPTGPRWPTVPEPVRYWLLPVEKKHLAEIPVNGWKKLAVKGMDLQGQPSPQHPIPPSPPPPQPPYSPAPVPGNAGAFVEMPLPQPPGYLIPVENLYWMNRDEIATRGNIPSVMVLEGGMEPYYGRIPDRSETAHITDPNHYVIRKGVRKPGDNIEVAGMKYDMQVPRDELIPLPEELAQGAQDAMVEAALKLRREGGRGCSLNVAVPAELVPPPPPQAQPSPPAAGGSGSPRGEKRGLDEEPSTCRIS
ncbi:hypothetical protein TYRP_011771 [Tyrophagus putrescentiae]|nr:hypothetical protein TYRP_011771 [Tyrophagus putrescentiae]